MKLYIVPHLDAPPLLAEVLREVTPEGATFTATAPDGTQATGPSPGKAAAALTRALGASPSKGAAKAKPAAAPVPDAPAA